MSPTTFTLLLLSDVFALSYAQSPIYHYVNRNVTWYEAQSTCREMFTDLATVYSKSDMDRLIQVLPDDSDSVWIGLRRSWVWSSGEVVSAYSNWKPSNPNEGSAQASCAVLTSEGWQDWYCLTYTYPFVCYNGNPSTDICTLVSTHYLLVFIFLTLS
ncbi:L-selectin-like [Brachyhypopomus gauderio]|uniref:L-selectin-like n=1 Tax=Brachyhypopomus gauderio TaxID=698409 RepID=UPI00404126E5